MVKQTEMSVARRVVKTALKLNYVVSVNDGEEWTVKQSKKFRDIVCALQTTDSDILRIRKCEGGERIGDIFLVWGNAKDGSELVSDHHDNLLTNELLQLAKVY